MKIIRAPYEEHRQDPALWAEVRFFDAMAAADMPGSIIHNLNIGRQVDAFSWTYRGGRTSYEVKGGQHWIDDGRWYCRGRDGNVVEMPYTPVEQAMQAALAASDALEKRLGGHKPWINAVLVLADMPEEVPAIAERARDHRVQVIWGLNHLDEQHRRLASINPEYHPPTDLDVEAEAAAFDRRNPPEGWEPAGHARRRTTGNGRNNASTPVDQATALAAVLTDPSTPQPGFSLIIHNHGTVVMQWPGQPPAPGTPDDALTVIAPAAPVSDPSEPGVNDVESDFH